MYKTNLAVFFLQLYFYLQSVSLSIIFLLSDQLLTKIIRYKIIKHLHTQF